MNQRTADRINGIFAVHADATPSEIYDSASAKLAQAEAALSALVGGGINDFRSLHLEVQTNILWQIEESVSEAHGLFNAFYAKAQTKQRKPVA